MIDVIFAGINFAILVGLALYGFVVYALPGVRSALQHEQAAHDERIAQRTQLRETCRNIETEISRQEERYHELYDRIITWAKVMREEQHAREKAYRAIEEQVQQRRHQQQMYRLQRKALQQHVSQAFAQAHHELSERYSGDAGQAYIRDIIAHVEQRHG